MRSIIDVFVPLLLSLAGNAYAMNFSVIKFNHPYDSALWTNEHGGMTPIYAEGKITNNTAKDFEKFIDRNHIKNGATVVFNSPGGSLTGAMALGNVIRFLGYDTTIGSFEQGKILDNGICASACAYSFSGGLGRYYSGKGSKLGIHQFYSTKNDIPGKHIQEVSGIIVAYLQKMGVDTIAFSVSTTVGPGEILWLTKTQARKMRFSNDGAYSTTYELKQAKKETYLKFEQDHISYLARFLLFCSDKEINLIGGIVSNPQAANELYNWATQSLFTFDETEIQKQRKEQFPEGIKVSDSSVWVFRSLSKEKTGKLLSAKYVTVWIAGDGAIGKTAKADIANDNGKIKNFVGNCYQ